MRYGHRTAMKRLHVTIPEDLWLDLQAWTERTGETASETVALALRQRVPSRTITRKVVEAPPS